MLEAPLLVRDTIEVVYPEFGGRGHPAYDRPWLDERTVETTPLGVTIREGQSVTGVDFATIAGCYSPSGAQLAILAHPYLAPTARPLLAEAGDLMPAMAYFGGTGRMADLWLSTEEEFALVSSEWAGPVAVAWSPDGGRIAYTSDLKGLSNDSSPMMVSVIDLVADTRMSFGPLNDGVLDVIAWAPSGDEVWIVATDDSWKERAYALSLSDQSMRLCDVPDGVQGFAWSDDGRALAVAHASGSETGVMVYAYDGSRRAYSTDGMCWMPVWIGDEYLLLNAREKVSAEGDNVSLDCVHALRLSDGAHAPVLHSEEVARGAWSSPRALDVRTTRMPAERWWDGLLADPTEPVAVIQDPRHLSENVGLWMDAKLELAGRIDPGLRARYEQDWRT